MYIRVLVQPNQDNGQRTIKIYNRYFSHLMTDKESRALRHLSSKEKLGLSNQRSNDQGKEQRIKMYKEKGWLSEDVEVLALLDNGNNEL